MRCLRPLFLAGALLVLLTSQSLAYLLGNSKWTANRTVLMHLSLTGQVPSGEDGFVTFNQSAEDALNIWNQDLIYLQFRARRESTMSQGDGDGDNSVFFGNNIFGQAFGRNTIAITMISRLGTVTTESDVIFNNAETWDSYRGELGGGLDFHRVALHEFGHVLGLDHPDQAGQTVNAIMNSRVGNIDLLQPDDINGARALYDQGPARLGTLPAPNFLNLSTRALVGTGNNALIGGFIIQGSQPATVILRGIGHSLAAYGVNNPLADPVLELRNQNGTLLAQNDDWISGSNAQTIASYALEPSNSMESALLQTLTAGNYTAIVQPYGTGAASGTGLVELYNLQTTAGRAGNIASRGQVLAGNNVMIAGFIIGGTQPKEVVVRGLGPSLTSAGVANTLANPTLRLVDGAGNTLGENDDWAFDPRAQRLRDLQLAPTSAAESALARLLNPGSYTVILRGQNDGTGIGLVEVYDLAPAPQ